MQQLHALAVRRPTSKQVPIAFATIASLNLQPTTKRHTPQVCRHQQSSALQMKSTSTQTSSQSKKVMLPLLTFLTINVAQPISAAQQAVTKAASDAISPETKEAVNAVAESATQAVGKAGEAASEYATEASRDNTLFSKVLLNVCLGLLVYATIGSIILTVDNFIKNRNDKLNRQWVKDRLEGRPFPSNDFLDQREDISFPKDFPVQPSSSEVGNRQARRVMKKTEKKSNRSKREKKSSTTSKRGVDSSSKDTKSKGK